MVRALRTLTQMLAEEPRPVPRGISEAKNMSTAMSGPRYFNAASGISSSLPFVPCAARS